MHRLEWWCRRYVDYLAEEGDKVLTALVLTAAVAGTAALVKHVFCYVLRGCGG